MTSNMIHLTVAAYQAELHRAANEQRHQASRHDGTSQHLPHARLRSLQARFARTARESVTVPRVAH